MKQKTASIAFYRIYGTNEFCSEVYYRGKLITCFNRHDITIADSKIRILEKAVEWALSNGFTRYCLMP